MVNRMKDLSFLKSNLVAYHGVYDNERIFENTLQAYARANKFGYIIQLDVKMLSCGTLVCFHDDNLERMLHVDHDLSKISYEELSYMAKYQIPTFEATLEAIQGSVPLIINISFPTKKNILEKKVLEIMDNYSGSFAIMSSKTKVLKWFNKNRPNFVYGYFVDQSNYRKYFLFKKYDFLNLDISLFSDKMIRKLRENKLVIGHLIKSKESYKQMRDVCDNLVLDNVLEIVS